MLDIRFIYRKIRYLLTRVKYNIFRKNVSLGRFVYFGNKVNISNHVSIGDCSYVGQYSFIASNTTLGNFSLLSDNVNIIGSDHVYDRPGVPIILSGTPIIDAVTTIGDDVWIGHAVTIMRGISIGNGSIVASNSVVTKSIPSYEIWAGVPAKKIGERFSAAEIKIHEKFIRDYSNGLVSLTHDRTFNGA